MLTAHFMCDLISDLRVCKHTKSMVVHDTIFLLRPGAIKQHKTQNSRTPFASSYYKLSSVCLFVCLFVPLLLRGPLTDLCQTWWVYVGGPRNYPWGVSGSTGQTSLFRSRRHQAETTPLQKARRLLPSKRHTTSKSLIPSTGIFTSKWNMFKPNVWLLSPALIQYLIYYDCLHKLRDKVNRSLHECTK